MGDDIQPCFFNVQNSLPVKSGQMPVTPSIFSSYKHRGDLLITAAVHGRAIRPGFSFALASDIRVISKDTRFTSCFIVLATGGADRGCSYFLPGLTGAGRAYEFMFTGRLMSAGEAMNLNLDCSDLASAIHTENRDQVL